MIRIENLRVDLPGFGLGVDGLDVPEGGFFALLGPTGSGKTLLLETVAGMTTLAGLAVRGKVSVAGRDVTNLPPESRGVSLVYQDNALFPHLDLMANVTYGLRCRGVARAEAESRALPLIEMLGLGRLKGRGVEGLSGGERQRVALARALVVEPDVLLLDEPLSALDPNFRADVRAMLKRLHRETGVTMFMVTHDFTDAMVLADRVAVLHRGALMQMGTPDDVFMRPADAFVAGFVGMRNVFEADFRPRDGGCAVRLCGRDCMLPGLSPEGLAHAALRPEDVAVLVEGDAPDGWVVLDGTLCGLDNHGFHYEVRAECGGEVVWAVAPRHSLPASAMQPGAALRLAFDPARVHVFA